MGEYGNCNVCQKDYTDYFRYCKPCQAKIFKKKFSDWSSGNDDIDEIIQSAQLNAENINSVLEWIPFSKFENIQMIGQGDFGCIYEATRLDGGQFWHLDLTKGQVWRLGAILKSLNTLPDLLNEVCSIMIAFLTKISILWLAYLYYS